MSNPLHIPDLVRRIFHYSHDYDILMFMCTCQAFHVLKHEVRLNMCYDKQFEAFAPCFKTLSLCCDPEAKHRFDHVERLQVQRESKHISFYHDDDKMKLQIQFMININTAAR